MIAVLRQQPLPSAEPPGAPASIPDRRLSTGGHGNLIIGIVFQGTGLQALLLYESIGRELDHPQTGVMVPLTGILEHGLDMQSVKAGLPQDFHHVQGGEQGAGQRQIHPVFRHGKCVGKALTVTASFHSSQGVEEAGAAFGRHEHPAKVIETLSLKQI